VDNATKDDLNVIMGWLKREYKANGEGFWCNHRMIKRCFKDHCVWVARNNGEAIAFLAGDFDILCVREDWQRRGIGTTLVNEAVTRVYNDGRNVINIECTPCTSLPFWEKHGFRRYGNHDFPILARRILSRIYSVPADLVRTSIVISFYEEEVLYKNSIEPIHMHELIGGMQDNSIVVLPQRIINCDNPTRGDLVVKIEVDGREVFFDKAKRDRAKIIGIEQDRYGIFFIDKIRMSS